MGCRNTCNKNKIGRYNSINDKNGMFYLVTNVYRNIPTDEKIKLYLKFCEYLTREQIQNERDKRNKNDTSDTMGKGAGRKGVTENKGN